MARRKKAGARTKSGRLSRAYTGPARDAGTPELQAKRQAIVGDGADPNLSVSAPGILFAKAILNREQYAQALTYRKLRAAIFGPPWPTNATAGEASDTNLIRCKRKLRALERRITNGQRHLIANVAVFDILPRSIQIPDLLGALDAMGATSRTS